MATFDTIFNLGEVFGEQEITVEYRWYNGFVSRDRCEPDEPAHADITSVKWRGIEIMEDMDRAELLDELQAEAADHYAEEWVCAEEAEADRRREERMFKEAA